MKEIKPEDIVRFWFSDTVRPKWFDSDPGFDSTLKERFEGILHGAKHGALRDWTQSAHGTLALIILLDQIPRNIYRGSPLSFATDDQALALSAAAVEKGFDLELSSEERQFLYLPFMHSESLQHQEQGVQLYSALGMDEPLRFMLLHRDAIARFGRFPHRNAILGRPSTEEEQTFLKEPGSHF